MVCRASEHAMVVLLYVLLLVMVIKDVLGTTIVQGLVRRGVVRGFVNIIWVALGATVLVNKVEILAWLPVELIFVPSTDLTEALRWEAIGNSYSGQWMLVHWLVFIGLMKVINFVLHIILYGLMMLVVAVVAAASSNLAFIHRNNLILSNAEIRYIADCWMRDWAFQDLRGRGSAGSGLNLLEVQFPSSGETDRRGSAVLFLI